MFSFEIIAAGRVSVEVCVVLGNEFAEGVRVLVGEGEGARVDGDGGCHHCLFRDGLEFDAFCSAGAAWGDFTGAEGEYSPHASSYHGDGVVDFFLRVAVEFS